ncbi:proprotein convertase P-domain-containing protein, partial [Marilutibacter maris]
MSGRSGNAPSDASVDVDIRHTYKGDLKVDLVAPDGSTYNIHN